MENDILRNKIAPWQEKGRWYHGVFDFVSRSFISEKTDSELLDPTKFELAQSGSNCFIYSLSHDHPIIDIVYKPHGAVTISSSTNYTMGIRRISSLGFTGISIAPYSTGSPVISKGECELYIFVG